MRACDRPKMQPVMCMSMYYYRDCSHKAELHLDWHQTSSHKAELHLDRHQTSSHKAELHLDWHQTKHIFIVIIIHADSFSLTYTTSAFQRV